MKHWLYSRKVNLAALLTLLVSSAIILTAVILIAASYHSEKKSLVNTYLSLNYSKSQKLSQSVDALFVSMKQNLIHTTDFISKNKQSLTDEEIQKQLELLQSSSQYFNSMFWIDETGVVRSLAPLHIGLKGQKITEGETKKVLHAKKPVLTAPYIGPSGRLLVLMSEPLYDQAGTYKGIIGGSIYLHEFNILNQILGNDVIDDSGSYYYVVSEQGVLLFHPHMSRIGENISNNSAVQQLMKGKSGTKEIVSNEGVPMLAAYSQLPKSGWGIVQQTPVSHVNEYVHVHIKEHIQYTLGPFLLLISLAVLIAQKLARPFQQLANAVSDFAEGNSASSLSPASHWNREADLLAKAVYLGIQTAQKNEHELVEETMTDALTGIPNRKKLEKEIKKLVEQQAHFSLAIIDVDFFKSVNDIHGHQAGDKVLKYVACLIQSNLQATGACFRYGGEEFVMLLPQINQQDACEIAEKIRRTLETTKSPTGKTVTVSIGVAEFPVHAFSLDELFELADKALYRSKAKGRNRVTVYSA